MNRWKRISSAISCFLTGSVELTPQQQARLDEMEKDCAALSRTKDVPDRSVLANPILPVAHSPHEDGAAPPSAGRPESKLPR